MDESTTTQVFDMVDLAFELADEMARADVEGYCAGRVAKGVRWLDTKEAHSAADRAIVSRAMRYIELRGAALPYKLLRDGNLVRFEDHD